MKTTIIGPGAVGTLIGGLLQLGGHDVTFVEKASSPKKSSPRARSSRARSAAGGSRPPARPLRLILPSGWLQADGARRAGAEAAPRDADACIVTLARHHLRVVRRPDFTRVTGGGDGPIFFFNADPAEAERLAVAPQRRKFGLTLLCAVKLQDGEAELADPEAALIVENAPGSEELFAGLEDYGIRVITVDSAAPYASSFFVFQLLFLPVALCNTTLPAFLASAEGREIARNILHEGFLTMEKLGQPLAPLPAMDPRELLVRIEKKRSSFDPARERPDRAYNTILQGFLADRPGEAAFLNRRLVEMASTAGIHLTWNWRITQKAGRPASVGFYRTPADLLRSLE